MNNILLSFFFVLCLPQYAVAQKVDVLAGTTVICETNMDIDESDAILGKMIDTRAKQPLVVDGKVVVATGAHGYARVKSFTPTTINNPAEITLELIYIEAVDGQAMHLFGQETTFKGRYPNESIHVSIGQVLVGSIPNSISINLSRKSLKSVPISSSKDPMEGSYTYILLRAGTPISIQLDALDDNLSVGNTVLGTIAAECKVNGKTAIAIGTQVECMVRRRTCSDDCKSIELQIIANHAQGVDGQIIYLRSAPLLITITKAQKMMPIRVSANVLNDVKINLSGSNNIKQNTNKNNGFYQAQNRISTNNTLADSLSGKLLLPAKRIALVIGNGNYAHATTLRNPVNDAQDMSDSLERLGFDVFFYKDLDEMAFTDVLSMFADTLKSYDVGLFYYAGHGMELNGENYLIPVDAKLVKKGHANAECITLNEVLRILVTPIKIVIIDACRDNPFARNWQGRSGIENGGLSPVYATASNLLLVFSAAPGAVANEQHPDKANGLFTGMLLNCLTQQCKTLSEIFECTSAQVQYITRQQIPFQNSSLSRGFYLQSCKL
jgi:Caspase domain